MIGMFLSVGEALDYMDLGKNRPFHLEINGKTTLDFGLRCTKFTLEAPKLKKHVVELKGANGQIDLTEVFSGRPMYSNRKLTAEFDVEDRHFTHWAQLSSEILNWIHGKKAEISLSTDPGYFYEGRITVTVSKGNKIYSSVKIEADCEPFKKQVNPTQENITVSGSKAWIYVSDEMPAIPVITCSSAMTVTFRGKTYALAAGENRIYELVTAPGENSYVFSGSGSVHFVCRGGRL